MSAEHRATRAISAVTGWLGSFASIGCAISLVVTWVIGGMFVGFTNTWHLLLNSPTTAMTFIMTFVILATQNRESRALHTKIDALIADSPLDQEKLAGLEELPEDEIKDRQDQVRDPSLPADGG